MNSEKLILRIAARCEAAGRPNNEDNYQVSENLGESLWGFTADKEISLDEKGSLLVVCDGMGGMNAGEVASAIAVQTIKEWFDATRLSSKVSASPTSIKKYIVEAIQAADAAIKNDSNAHAEHEGMGSTIVLAWLIDKKVYVGWCGDSRAYRYNPQYGLVRLSHDHSYVQELVDAGKLTEELAFDHPNNNIITRSLGDPRGKAQPDVKEYELCDDDIILLCSDGLCGCLRDNEIEEVIKQHQSSMQECRDALWEADEAAGWHDNVTTILAQVISGGEKAEAVQQSTNSISNSKIKWKRRSFILAAIACLLLIVIAILCWRTIGKDIKPVGTSSDTVSIVPEFKLEEDSSQQVEPAVIVSESSAKASYSKEIKSCGNQNENVKGAQDEVVTVVLADSLPASDGNRNAVESDLSK